MKKYYFSEYDGNSGKDKLFDTREEAIDFATYSWNHTTDKEKKDLSWCYVAEVELTEEEIAAFEDGDVVDALESTQKVIWDLGKEI